MDDPPRRALVVGKVAFIWVGLAVVDQPEAVGGGFGEIEKSIVGARVAKKQA